ncbi:MAG: hypothetical protein ACFBWO_10575, partial [Paracoccaceae bacterium]
GEGAGAKTPPDLQPTPKSPPRTPRPPAMPEAAARPRRGGSAAGVWLAALVALLVGAIGALWAAPHIAPHVPSSVADVLISRGTTAVAEIDALEQRVVEAEDRVETAAQAVDDRASTEALGALEDRVSDLAGRVRAEDAPDNATLADRLASLEQRLGEMARGGEESGAAAGERLDQLARRLDQLEQADPAVSPEAFADVQARLDALEGAAPEVSQEDLAGVAERIAALEGAEPEVGAEELDQLAGRLRGLEDTAPTMRSEIAALAGRIESIEGGPEAATAEDFAALNELVRTMERDLEDARRRVAEAEAARDEAEARAVEQERLARLNAEAKRLRLAMKTGTPFEDALRAIAETAGEAPPEPLPSKAEAGVPTTEALSGRFQVAARQALRAETGETTEDGGPLEQLGAWLGRQVTARPTGAVEGEGTAARLGRIQAALDRGDAGRALEEAEGLSQTAKGAIEDWIADLRVRVAAGRALDSYLADIGAGLGDEGESPDQGRQG